MTQCTIKALHSVFAWCVAAGDLRDTMTGIEEQQMKMNTRFYFVTALAVGLMYTPTGIGQTCKSSITPTTPSTEFIMHGDGTLTHVRTGLMWKQCLEGQSGFDCIGEYSLLNGSEALSYAESHQFSGYTDWRLPNIKELASIVESACYSPALNLSVFRNAPGTTLWSSSPNANRETDAWKLNFYAGHDTRDGQNDKDLTYAIRLVRDTN